MKRNSLGLMCALALLTLTVACSPGVQATQKQSPKSAPSSAKLVMPAQPPKTLASVGFVEDPEQLFSPTERGKIDTLLRKLERSIQYRRHSFCWCYYPSRKGSFLYPL